MAQSDASDDDSDDSDKSDASDDSAESESEEKQEKPVAEASKKRKADIDEETPAKKAKAVETSEKPPSATLFVGNLSWNVDDDTLYEEFKYCGDILGARVITDRATQRSRGFGYVDFSSVEAAQKAFEEKQGAFLDGRDLKIDYSSKNTETTPNNRATKFGNVNSPSDDPLFVGTLSF